MRTVIDLMREYVRVSDMCKGTPLEDKPWECVKYEGRSHDLGHPTFLGLPENYTFALAILEGKPVFINDKVYLIYAQRTITITNEINPADITDDCCTWSPPTPKRTFMLNGVELPCPVRIATGCSLYYQGETFFFNSDIDRSKWNNAILTSLTEARDKE